MSKIHNATSYFYNASTYFPIEFGTGGTNFIWTVVDTTYVNIGAGQDYSSYTGVVRIIYAK
jgi:hypothetical protein